MGRRVAFKVSKARVSFPRRESYGLEARFKVTTHLVLLQILLVGCWITFSFFTMFKLFLASWFLQVWVESEELEALRRAAIQRALPRWSSFKRHVHLVHFGNVHVANKNQLWVFQRWLLHCGWGEEAEQVILNRSSWTIKDFVTQRVLQYKTYLNSVDSLMSPYYSDRKNAQNRVVYFMCQT